MFALVAWDTLYFKADDVNRPEYEQAGLEPFTYTDQRGRAVQMSYYEAPAEGLEDPGLLSAWGKEAFAAALRASPPVPPESRRRRA
jgi:DNA transformation protein